MTWATKRELRALRRAWRHLVREEGRLGGIYCPTLAASVRETRLRLEDDLWRLRGGEERAW